MDVLREVVRHVDTFQIPRPNVAAKSVCDGAWSLMSVIGALGRSFPN
jgi:hypothetical protein